MIARLALAAALMLGCAHPFRPPPAPVRLAVTPAHRRLPSWALSVTRFDAMLTNFTRQPLGEVAYYAIAPDRHRTLGPGESMSFTIEATTQLITRDYRNLVVTYRVTPPAHCVLQLVYVAPRAKWSAWSNEIVVDVDR